MAEKIKNSGKVYLVGAGPGAPDLITLRAAELLKIADCIIIDKLANPALLKYAKQNAEIIHTPKRAGPASVTQDTINMLMVEKALAGKIVVRLKGGDPCIFSRVSQETAALSQAGIDFEIVPGITAAVAVASYAGILLTDRDYASQLIFVTGREADDKQTSNIDWHLLAKFKGTIVFYMGLQNLNVIVENLLTNGLDEKTPAAVVADVTLPTQKIVKSTIAKIASESKKQNIQPPALLIIGTAAEGDNTLNWFMKKPLFGKTILLTRDAKANARLAAEILKRGGNPLTFNTVQIKPLTDKNEFLKTLTTFSNFHWIIFTSQNGVEIFFGFLAQIGKDCRVFANSKIAAVGTKTADKLREYGIIPDFVPAAFTTEQLARQLISFENLKNKNVLLLRSLAADKTLDEVLQKAGAKLQDTPIYEIVPVQSDTATVEQNLKAGCIDWLTFASPSAVKFFFEKFSAGLVKSSKVKIASIGPVTSKQLKNFGFDPEIEATEHTIDSLIDAIESSYR
jgi:uroporphyrinogen III methyltransferase/synthase